MRHAAHKAAKVSHAQFSLSKALSTANRGSHTAKAVRMAQLAEGGAVVGLAPEVVDKLNEVAPMSRRAMREAAKAASRKSALVTSASLAALVGTAATALAFSQQNAFRLVLADITVRNVPDQTCVRWSGIPFRRTYRPLRNWLPPATTAVGSWEHQRLHGRQPDVQVHRRQSERRRPDGPRQQRLTG